MADGSIPRRQPPKREPLRLTPVRWAEDGMTVWIMLSETRAVRCTVAVAMGDHARVVQPHPAYCIDTWYRLESLRVEKGDPHGYD